MRNSSYETHYSEAFEDKTSCYRIHIVIVAFLLILCGVIDNVFFENIVMLADNTVKIPVTFTKMVFLLEADPKTLFIVINSSCSESNELPKTTLSTFINIKTIIYLLRLNDMMLTLLLHNYGFSDRQMDLYISISQ